jgi:hypothetical protein
MATTPPTTPPAIAGTFGLRVDDALAGGRDAAVEASVEDKGVDVGVAARSSGLWTEDEETLTHNEWASHLTVTVQKNPVEKETVGLESLMNTGKTRHFSGRECELTQQGKKAGW